MEIRFESWKYGLSDSHRIHQMQQIIVKTWRGSDHWSRADQFSDVCHSWGRRQSCRPRRGWGREWPGDASEELAGTEQSQPRSWPDPGLREWWWPGSELGWECQSRVSSSSSSSHCWDDDCGAESPAGSRPQQPGMIKLWKMERHRLIFYDETF